MFFFSSFFVFFFFFLRKFGDLVFLFLLETYVVVLIRSASLSNIVNTSLVKRGLITLFFFVFVARVTVFHDFFAFFSQCRW